MAKKKINKRAKAGLGEMPTEQQVEGTNRKRVSANGSSRGHPCPNESPTRKRKSLSQFVSPSPNSKKRMQAAIAAAREGGSAMKKFRVFERRLAQGVAMKALGGGRVTSGNTSAVLPKELHIVQEQQSPTPTTRGRRGLPETLQGSEGGVYDHPCETRPLAQKEVQQQDILLAPLIRARRILDFPETAPLKEFACDGGVSLSSWSPMSPTPLSPVEPRILEPTLTLPAKGSVPFVPTVLAEEGDDSLVREQGVISNKDGEFPAETAPENELDSRKYGEQERNGRVDETRTIQPYPREYVDRLLSLLSPHERETFLRTHPVPAPINLLAGLPTETQVIEFEIGEMAERVAAADEGLEATSNLVTHERFHETLQDLERDEKKYRKRHARKLARQVEGKGRAMAEDPKVFGKSTANPKPTVGPCTVKCPAGKNNASPSTGGSLGMPSSSAARTSVQVGDPVVVHSSWDMIQGIPPFEVNTLAEPTGEFWEHMRRYALEQTRFEFPWHVDWNKQCPELKARFTLKLRQVYPGPWEAKSILRAIGANLRERRTRLKRKFEKCTKMKQVSRPAGCSKGSYMIIYESTNDRKKQKKAKLCKEAADKRFKDQGPTHRCGPRGLKGLHDRFVDYFNRPPTDGELEFGKQNGWANLKARMEKNSKVQHVGQGENGGSTSIDHVVVNHSCSSDSSSSGTSENSNGDGDSTTSESEEE